HDRGVSAVAAVVCHYRTRRLLGRSAAAATHRQTSDRGGYTRGPFRLRRHDRVRDRGERAAGRRRPAADRANVAASSPGRWETRRRLRDRTRARGALARPTPGERRSAAAARALRRAHAAPDRPGRARVWLVLG